jgi:predicted transcriptional regulator
MEGFFRWLCCLIYLLPLPRRQRFPLLAAGGLVLSVVVDLLSVLFVPVNLLSLALPALALVYVFVLGVTCTDAEKSISFYLGIWGLLTYAVLYELWFYILRYGLPWGAADQTQCTVAWLLLAAAVLGSVGLTVPHWMPVYHSDRVGPRQMISALSLYIIFMLLISSFQQGTIAAEDVYYMVPIFFVQTYCITVLYLQTALFEKSAIQHELDTMNVIYQQHMVQYQRSKENVDLINQKCHDMKHQLAALRTMDNSERKEQYIQELQKSLDIYDATFQTGNETLDTVLTEKSLLCKANRITVHCVADGARLSFMDPVDIYTVMGNALDNAMEAVCAFEQEELRTIDVLIHVRQHFLVISVTNPLQQELKFVDNLPQSTKPKDGYHGFGVRSMRSIIRKYGGELTAAAEGGLFALRMLIPITEGEE